MYCWPNLDTMTVYPSCAVYYYYYYYYYYYATCPQALGPNCPVRQTKKEQQSQHHNTYIISTVNQSVQQQSVKPGPWKGALATRIEQSTSS